MIPWYRTFFGPPYWQFARHEYTAQRTAQEVNYLVRVLEEFDAGPRVVDLGCGMARHAIGLARAGRHVTGIDVEQWVLESAAREVADAGVDVTMVEADLLRGSVVDVSSMDAAICIQSFGWGADDEQLALLRRIHRMLNADGLLVLDITNPTWILANYEPDAEVTLDGTLFTFHREYDAASGRSRGFIDVTGTDGVTHHLEHDIRLYTVPEAVALVRAAGFDVSRIDADFRCHTPVGLNTRYAQLIARPVSLPPTGLSVRSYDTAVGTELDLRWSPDEGDLLEPNPRDVFSEFNADLKARGGWDAVRRYSVDDAYAARRSRPVLSRHFGVDLADEAVHVGAGVCSLSHSLSALAADSTVLVSTPLAFRDIGAWARARGARTQTCDGSLAVLLTRLREDRPRIVHLDRPDPKAALAPLEVVREIARELATHGGLLIVDEANATYLGPAASCVPLVTDVPNLIVLRGMSKGYGAGGLRIGFAIASAELHEPIRECLPPLQASEFALQLSWRLLAGTDVFARLREHVRRVKPGIAAKLRGAGFDVADGHDALPWLVIDGDAERVLDAFTRLGIAAKRLRSIGGRRDAVRVSIPLSEERRARFADLFT